MIAPELLKLVASLRSADPRDTGRWFQPIKGGRFAPPGAPPATQICMADPQRVALIIASGSSVAYVTPIQADADAGIGMPIGIQGAPLVLTVGDHGLLCQVPWFIIVGGGTPVYVIEVLINDWPRP